MNTHTAPMAVVIRKPAGGKSMPDNAQYTNRFEIKSQTSNRIYTIAQHKSGRWWSCSCPGWISHRKCKHLTTIGVPCFQAPFEAKFAA